MTSIAFYQYVTYIILFYLLDIALAKLHRRGYLSLVLFLDPAKCFLYIHGFLLFGNRRKRNCDIKKAQLI